MRKLRANLQTDNNTLNTSAMEWIQENTMLIEQINRKLTEVDKLYADTKLHVELNRHLRGAINYMRMIESEGNPDNARTKPSINYDGVLGTVDYRYEHLFISDEGEPCPIDGWMPIATERIKHPERIPEYIERGRLRLIKPQ